jgi:hypothetical protein
MSSWSRQRRSLYGGSVILFIAIIAGFLSWKLFYKAPSCFDGIQNGKEQGTDCGGACQKLCPTAFLTPQNIWTRFEKIAPGLYNVAAYIVNPNPDGEAKDVPYHMQVYDDRGILVTEYNGAVTLPPHRNTLAFHGSINLGERNPSKAVFTFTGTPDWNKKSDSLAPILVIDKSYTEENNSSSLSVTLKNNAATDQGKLSVYVILYDKNTNAIGFSKTIVDGIKAGGTVVAPFTWPVNRQGTVISIEVLPVAE